MLHKYYFILAILLIIIDQLSKIWITHNIALSEVIEINSFLNITHLQNKGAAFSLFSDYVLSRYLLPTISIIAVIVLTIWILKTHQKNTLKLLSLSMILAGAFGNLIGRFYNGFVVDFISLHYNQYYFAVFNLADSFISIAVVLLLSKDDVKNP